MAPDVLFTAEQIQDRVRAIRKRLAILQKRGAKYDEIVTHSNLAWGLRTLGHLRAGQFDLVLALHKSFRTAWLLAAARIPREQLSFMNESRRLDNSRLKRVLGVRLRYPTIHEGLAHEHTIGAH